MGDASVLRFVTRGMDTDGKGLRMLVSADPKEDLGTQIVSDTNTY